MSDRHRLGFNSLHLTCEITPLIHSKKKKKKQLKSRMVKGSRHIHFP